jgi:hypothetical protein
MVPLLVIKTNVIIAINNNGTAVPPTCNEKTSLVFGHSTTVDALPFM